MPDPYRQRGVLDNIPVSLCNVNQHCEVRQAAMLSSESFIGTSDR